MPFLGGGGGRAGYLFVCGGGTILCNRGVAGPGAFGTWLFISSIQRGYKAYYIVYQSVIIVVSRFLTTYQISSPNILLSLVSKTLYSKIVTIFLSTFFALSQYIVI